MRASIDLGSNSALLLVMKGDQVLHDEATVVGLGRGLADGGLFRPDRVEAALEALHRYAQTLKRLGVEPGDARAIATSASRRATDAEAFYKRVLDETGLRFRIVTGEEEAQLTFMGAKSDVQGRVAVVDLGGGSTEIVVGDTHVDWRHSFEVGSVRLTEQVLGEDVRVASVTDLDRMRALLPFVAGIPPAPIVAVAGTATTIAAWTLGSTAWDAEAVHGAVLTDAQLADLEQRLLGLDAGGRRALFAVGAARADSMLAGAVILRGVLSALGRDSMQVSVRGLRFGALRRT